MKFNKKSYLVLAWVRLVERGKYRLDQVPEIGNLKEKVMEVVEENKKKQEVER